MSAEQEEFKLTWALRLASQGFRVHPLQPNSKIPPAGSEWKADATDDPAIIRAWFTDDPRINYLVAPDEDHFVLDPDVKGERNGIKNLEDLQDLYGDLPDTLVVQTPSGGYHIYWQGRAPVSAGKASLGGGIDVRGNVGGKAGYVVGPGSTIDGKPYTVVTEHPIAPAPGWLIQLCEQPTVAPMKRPEGVKIDNAIDVPRMRRRLTNLVEQGDVAIEFCGGNNRTYKLFCELLDYLSPEKALELAQEIWNPACVPPWSDTELQTICDHAMAHRQNEVGAKASRPATEVFKGVVLPNMSPPVVPEHPASFRALTVVDDAPDFPDVGNNGALKATTANARVALQAVGLQCRHDVFHDKLIVGGRALGQWVGPVTDEIVARLCHMTYEAFHFEPEPKKMQLAVQQLCFENKFNPVTDYLDGLEWDGLGRIDTWLIDHAGAPDTPYVRAVSRIALVAAVRRARQPGCKFDEILVLEGREGLGKSGMIELMAGSENFSDQSILAADDRKQQEQMAGVWLYEIADLTGIRNAEVEKIKAFASRQEDRSRPAYGHFLKAQKRQCILIATTNDTDFLQSQTGNRRWWPIPVTKPCDLKALAAVRDQLWGEAAHQEAQGVSIRLPKELWATAGEEQEKRRLSHPWEDILATVTGDKYPVPGRDDQHEQRILSGDVFGRYLRLEPSKQNGWTGKTVKQIMRRLGWEHRHAVRIGGRVSAGYVRTAEGPLPDYPAHADELPDDPFVNIPAR